MWKRALGTVFLLATSPAFASDSQLDANPGRPVDADHVASEVRDLAQRVRSLEERVERLERPPRTPEDQASARIERERKTEFLRHVWTDG